MKNNKRIRTDNLSVNDIYCRDFKLISQVLLGHYKMMVKAQYSKIKTCTLKGIDGLAVDIELSVLSGLPSFEIRGNCDSTIKESRDRVRSAIIISGFTFPKGRVIASYAPADLPKSGSSFDLALAIALLSASGQIVRPHNSPSIAIFGELSLNARVNSVPGILNRLLSLEKDGIREIIGPVCSFDPHPFLTSCSYYEVNSLSEAIEYYSGIRQKAHIVDRQIQFAPLTEKDSETEERSILDQIAGQEAGIRAITIAAAGWHPLLLMGAPGCGKSSLATALIEIMPKLSDNEVLDLLLIEQLAESQSNRPSIVDRPFRRPHHSITSSALLGGGMPPHPGECTLAHSGVLFLDEITEIRPQVLDALREPMELKHINLSRSNRRVTYPANFLLVAACNPCRCGERLEGGDMCRCSEYSVERHLNRISGPLYDRFDLVAQLNRVKAPTLEASLIQAEKGRGKYLKESVQEVWAIQAERSKQIGKGFYFNSNIPADQLLSLMYMSDSSLKFISNLSEKMHFSFRAFHSVLRVSRTIADLRASDKVEAEDLALALDYKLSLADMMSENWRE